MKLKKTLLSVVACMLVFVIAFAFAACVDKKPDTPTITAIELKATEEIEAGQTVNVITEIKYSDGSTKKTNDSDIEWLTSDEKVATVTRGVVSGKAKGTATITAKAGDVTSNACAVTVIASREIAILQSGNAVTELTLDKESNPNANLTVKVTREGAELKDQDIEWSSSDATKVAVDQTGKVTAIVDSETPVTITATIKGTAIKASIPVTVTWEAKSNYEFGATYEQNKSPAGLWNYWGDKNYNWTNTTIFSSYGNNSYETGKTPAAGYEYIGANKVTIEFTVENPTVNDAAIQLFFRSSEGNGGKLKVNHNYEVTLKLESNVSGAISLNDYRNVPGGAASMGTVAGEICEEVGDNYLININEGVNSLSVKFRHGDSGAIYADQKWDNVESAIQLCMGKLVGEHVVVSVYDIQYKDLGEATNKFTDNPSMLANYDPGEEYEEGETFEAVYTETSDKGTDDGIVDNEWAVWYVQDAGWNCGEPVTMDKKLDTANKKLTATFAAGDNNWSVQVHYKHPNVVSGKTYRLSVVIDSDTAYSVSINGKTVALEVGTNNINVVFVAGNWAVDMSCANTANDNPITLTFSNLKWTELIVPDAPSHPAEPEVKPISATTVTGVTLTVEDGKAIYNLAGKVDLAQFNNDVETAKTWLTATHFDLQNLEDGWTANAFDRVNVTVNADGTFVIKYDITYLAVKDYAYTSHFTAKESTEDGYSDNKYRDVKLSEEKAVPGASITVGGKKYSIKNVVNSGAQADNWGVVSIKVENA